jgi:hypothetical protein
MRVYIMASPNNAYKDGLDRYTIKFTNNASNEDIELVERLVKREGGYIVYYQTLFPGFDVMLSRRALVYLKVNPAVRGLQKI